MGEAISLADPAFMPTVVRMVDMKLNHLREDLPAIQECLDCIRVAPPFGPT